MEMHMFSRNSFPFLLKPLFPSLMALGIFASSVFSPGELLADVYKCNGKWTNVPCDGSKPAPNKGKKKHSENAEGSRDVYNLKKKKEEWETREKLEDRKSEKVLAKKAQFGQSLRKMNRECKHFSGSDIKSFESFCKKKSTPIEQCRSRWNAMHSEMLGSSKNEKCRNIIFDLTR